MGQQILEQANYKITYPDTWSLDKSGIMGTKFLLFSPVEDAQDNFRENVNLVVEDVSAHKAIDLDQFMAASKSQIKSMISGAEIISSENLGEYSKMLFSGQQGIYNLKFEQHVYLKDGFAYILTFTAKEDAFDEYSKTAEEIMSTFKL